MKRVAWLAGVISFMGFGAMPLLYTTGGVPEFAGQQATPEDARAEGTKTRRPREKDKPASIVIPDFLYLAGQNPGVKRVLLSKNAGQGQRVVQVTWPNDMATLTCYSPAPEGSRGYLKFVECPCRKLSSEDWTRLQECLKHLEFDGKLRPGPGGEFGTVYHLVVSDRKAMLLLSVTVPPHASIPEEDGIEYRTIALMAKALPK